MRKTRTRREILRTLGAGTLLSPLVSCAPTPDQTSYRRAYSRKPFVAPRIAMDNVVREVVGHRPYRPAGFVVKSERFDNRLVVHNYGHGGGGLSLSWGSSALALREISGIEPTDVAVIGSGVMGLTSARLLQDAGWKVTIYTRDVARHTTSNIAAGEWSPYSVYDPQVATPAFVRRFDWAARVAHHAYTNLGGPDYGVRWVELYELSESRFEQADNGDVLSDLFPYRADLEPGQHPFSSPYARRSVTMRIDPAVLLRRLTQDFQVAGGRYVIRHFKDVSEVLSLSERIVFNCTGLGAAELFGDSELVPAKGQLVFLPPDPDVDYLTIGGGKGILYMFSRCDVLLLGGTFKLGDYTRAPDPDETERIVSEHERIFSSFA